MIKVFIGSSTEAKDRGIVPKIIRDLGRTQDFNVKPWYDFFDQGRFILESLLTISKEVDAAVLIFTKDDTREYRGRTDQVARDNVVLEAGLFLAQLGRERVWILAEKGSTLPVDFSGLIVSWFESSSDGNEAVLNATLALFINEIKTKWGNLSPIQQSLNREEINDCGIGIKETIKAYTTQLEQLSISLKNFSLNPDIKVRDPALLR